MSEFFQNIKNWISDWRFHRNHDKDASRLNSELEKRYYKSNSTDIIKILTELDKKAGLSSYDIVPFLKKKGLMPYRYTFVEKGSGGKITDRHRNDELFKELEQLEFIRIIENKLFSKEQGRKFPTSAEECVLKVKLLPKGIDYLTEHQKRKDDKFFKILSVFLLGLTTLISLPQSCIGVLEYLNKDNTVYKIDIVGKNSEAKIIEKKNANNNIQDSLKNGISKNKPIPKPIFKPVTKPIKSGI